MQNLGETPGVIEASSQGGPGLVKATLILEGFSRRFEPVVRWLMYIGAAILFIWTCFMFTDVLLRYVFNRPIPGSMDITSIILIILCFFSVAYTQLNKGHIIVDLITSRLRPKAALALSTAVYIICTVISGILVWQGTVNTLHHYNLGTINNASMPIYPSAAIVPFGSLFLFIVFLRDLLGKILECLKLRLGVVTWFPMLVLPLSFMAVAFLGMHHILEGMSTAAAGGLGILILFILIFLGMPVAFALFAVTVALMGYSCGAGPGFATIGANLYTHVSSYSFSVVPLYILMSYFILAGGLGTSVFWGAYKWIGHVRGGLSLAVVGGSTALAAVVGTGTAATVTMGLVAYPEMKKYKYADSLATGVIAAGATLGPIIPPSLGFIIYGIIAQESIGSLFIAGIIPGAMMAISFAAVVLIGVRINPQLGTAAPRASWGERMRSLPSFGPIVLLFLIVIGGIYGGVFTAMEGGGIGAFMALVIALVSRSIKWEGFKNALTESMKFAGMIFFVIAGGLTLSNSFGASGVSALLVESCKGIGLAPTAFVAILLLIYLLFGIVCDAPLIIILTLPILCPMLKAMGIDLIWFGVITGIMAGLGTITPPFAMGIFMLRSIAMPDIPLGTMFRGIIPFCVSTLVVIVLLLIFPSLATWLPSVMR